MVRGEYKNGVRECGVIKGWRGNHRQQRQHKVVGMKICMSWALNYLAGDKGERAGNGSDINFDLLALRNGYKEMKEWAKERGRIEIEEEKKNDSEYIWKKTKNALQKMIVEKFPPVEGKQKDKNEKMMRRRNWQKRLKTVEANTTK